MAKKKKSKFEKKYGFPASDIYSLNTWLAGALSARLLAWVDSGMMSYDPRMSFEEWEKQVRTAGEALKKYYEGDTITVVDKKAEDDAIAALHWVADNFPGLWD